MPFAVTHIILTIVLLDLFRHYVFGKEKFPRYLLVVGGVAGLLADIDVPFTGIYNFFTGSAVNFHGVVTHSLIFPLIFLVIAGVLHYKRETKWAKIFYVITAGLIFHLVLDCLFGGNYAYFWPFTTPTFCPQWDISEHFTGIDAIILVVWLVHEELHNRIKDYI